MNFKISTLCEYVPIIIFFIAFKFFGMMAATYSLLVATIIAASISYYHERKISHMQLLTLILVIIMGGLTIYSGDSRFIKMKPTIINFVFFIILMIGIMLNKGLMKYALGQKFAMNEQNWIIFSKRWALFFLFCGALNEIIWRNFSEDFWINFKAFGLMILTILFIIPQMKFLTKNSELIKEDEKK